MPSPLWYYTDGFSTFGPFDASAIRQLKAAGVIRSIHTLHREGDDTALPLSAVDDAPNGPVLFDTIPLALVESSYHVSHNGTTFGPFKVRELNEMIRRQEISTNDFVWKEGMNGWTPVADLPEFYQTGGTPPPLVLSSQQPPKPPEDSPAAGILGIIGVILLIGSGAAILLFVYPPGFIVALGIWALVKAMAKGAAKKW